MHPRAEACVAQRSLRMGDLLVSVCVDRLDDGSVPSPPAAQWLEVVDLQRMSMRVVQLPTTPAGTPAQQGGATYRSTFFSRVLGIAPLSEVRTSVLVVDVQVRTNLDLSQGCIAMLHSDGQIRVLQVAPAALARELDAWQQIRGVSEEAALSVRVTDDDAEGAQGAGQPSDASAVCGSTLDHTAHTHTIDTMPSANECGGAERLRSDATGPQGGRG